MAFELLTDRLPYDATNNAALMLQRINAEPLDPAKVKPALSDEMCALLRQLTAKRREQRLADMKTLPETFRSIPAKRKLSK
jgi:serine/threonine-protein kinase